MRRTQIQLDDQLWNVVQTRARSERKTISALVREILRERYLGKFEKRRQAMQAIVGIRQEPPNAPDSTEYVGSLRRGKRMQRLLEK